MANQIFETWRRLQDSNLRPATHEIDMLRLITGGAADVRASLAEGDVEAVDRWLRVLESARRCIS